MSGMMRVLTNFNACGNGCILLGGIQSPLLDIFYYVIRTRSHKGIAFKNTIDYKRRMFVVVAVYTCHYLLEEISRIGEGAEPSN